jgi:hypothetical protein
MRVTLYVPERAALTCPGQVAWTGRPIHHGDRSVGVAFDDDLNFDLVAGIIAAERFPLRGQVPASSIDER